MTQVTSTTSWGKRIIQSLVGMLVGLALVLGGFFVIFWNEGNGLHTEQSLLQTEKMLIRIPSSPIDPKNNLKVIYTTGLADAQELLRDSLLDYSHRAIKLIRHVEMYQWAENVDNETQKKTGGSTEEVTTYTYKQIWSANLIDSSTFHERVGHENPNTMPAQSTSQTAKHVLLGDFTLSDDLIGLMPAATPIDLAQLSDLSNIEKRLNLSVHHEGTGLYAGSDPETPQVGDLRISLSAVLPQTVSVIAQQNNHVLQTYEASAGSSIALLDPGEKSAQTMLDDAKQANRITTWLIRIVSMIMLMLGINLMLRPLSVLGDIIPFIGDIIGLGTGLISCLTGLFIWAVATAIAWFVVRPLWSISLVILVTIMCYCLFKKAQKKATNMPMAK